LDKIEGGDSKREVGRIILVISRRKMSLVESSHGQSWSSMGGTMGTLQRGERGGRRRGRGGHGWGCGLGRGRHGKGQRSSAMLLRLLSICGGAPAFCTREKTEGGRRKEKKKKRKENKRKKEKYGNFSKLENFQKINIIYEVGQKIFLYKKDICRIINK
jgi:hypothetical protein